MPPGNQAPGGPLKLTLINLGRNDCGGSRMCQSLQPTAPRVESPWERRTVVSSPETSVFTFAMNLGSALGGKPWFASRNLPEKLVFNCFGGFAVAKLTVFTLGISVASVMSIAVAAGNEWTEPF